MTDSFLNRLVSSFEANRHRVAMRIIGDQGSALTFQQALDLIRETAAAVRAAGINPSDRIAIMGENHPLWAISYLAVLYSGAVAVPLDPQGEIETVTNFIKDSQARLAFVDNRQIQRLQRIEEKLGRHIKSVVWNNKWTSESNGDSPPTNGFVKFDDFIATAPGTKDTAIPDFAGDDLALLIYTSGTTGKPKGVPLTHGNILAELDGINEVLEIDKSERILSLLPLFHAYLQIVNLWVATTYGCETGYLKELSPAELSFAMIEFRPTILTTVPRLWYLFHKKIFDAIAAKPLFIRALFRAMLAGNGILRDTLGVNLGKLLFSPVHKSFGGALRLAVSAGSRFDEGVARDFHRLGFTILQGYGLTETSGAATATYADDNRVGTVGKPLKGAEIRIAEKDADGVGEVQIRGPIVFKGYYKNPAATAEAFTDDGWFRSGDLGRIDKHGHLHIVGRAKDVIVLPSGKNVHPEDLEIHYLKAPEIEEIAVIGIADTEAKHRGTEKLVAIIVPDFDHLKSAGIANSREAIRFAMDSLGRELPEYQRIREYIIRSEPLPRTATRKIKRFQLKADFESAKETGDLRTNRFKWTQESSHLMNSPSGRLIVKLLEKNVSSAAAIHPDMNIEIDLGLDSLARAEFFAGLEVATNATIRAEDAARLLTIADVICFVDAIGGVDDAPTSAKNWPQIISETTADMPEVRPILKKRPLFTAFAFIVYRLFYLFCLAFMRLEVLDIDNLHELDRKRQSSGTTFIVCPNHQSFLDPFVLCSTYPYSVFANIFHVGASEFFQSAIMKFVASMLKVIPIDPDTQLLKAMKAGAVGLKNQKILNIYPEGERAFDGHLHRFKKGAAILSLELEVPILPVAIDGLYKVWPRATLRIQPAKVKIKFGRPIYPHSLSIDSNSEFADASPTKKYEILTERIRSEIEHLLKDR